MARRNLFATRADADLVVLRAAESDQYGSIGPASVTVWMLPDEARRMAQRLMKQADAVDARRAARGRG